MTRKRFVKLMMGLGYSRNEAVNIAARANRYGVSYADRWAYENSPMGAVRRAAKRLADGFKAMAKAIRKNIIPAVRELARKINAGIMTPNEARAALALDPIDDALEPAPMWPKENPHLDGLRTDVVLVDELAASGPALTPEQIKATTATWPGTTVMVGVDLANAPDVAAEITVAGGAENAD